jgi:phospholipid/cholesterol/gamma-HCH transport system permease protein
MSAAHSDQPVLSIKLDGAVDRHTVSDRFRGIPELIRTTRSPEIVLDLTEVTSMDSAGAALCRVISETAGRKGATVHVTGVSAGARDALKLFRVAIQDEDVRKRRPNVFEQTGDAIDRMIEGVIDMLVLVVDTFYLTVSGIWNRLNRVRGEYVLDQMVRIGLESLGIVALISLLVGITIALQSASTLRNFGADVYLADFVGIAMAREMGPLMTAILVAGRCGSSIAAEISTMVITEEVDALKTMGINPIRHLVIPRFLAISMTQPLLSIMSVFMGILGGMFVGITYMDQSIVTFNAELWTALTVKDVVTSLIKSVSFAWIIVFVGAHRGFKVRGGAEGVGIATTSSVVQAIFTVIAADAIFSLIFWFDW